MHALPALWCRDEALRPRVGFNAQQVRQGICQRGATTRQRERAPGPICTDPLASHIVKVHGRDLEAVCNGAMCALATAYRLQGEQAATGGEPIGWQRWRRQRLEHTRNLVSVFTQGAYGIFHLAESSLLSGVTRKDVPPGIGTLPEILAKYSLQVHG